MIYLICLFTGLILIVSQSLMAGVFLPGELAYDILIPLVVYLSLYHPNGKSLLLVLCLGLMLDGITGGPMGIYVLTYFWMFAGIQMAVQFLQKDSPVLTVSAILLGVLLENGLLLAVGALSVNRSVTVTDMTGTICGRLVMAAITGPLLLYALRLCFQRLISRSSV